MIDCRFKAISAWPSKPTVSRTHGPFKATWQKTLDLLEKELTHLRARNITIELFLDRQQIRNDGWPRSDARPSQPGVILSYTTQRGQFSMPCDKFLHWQSNLRAIALTLEHLRAVERYGVVTDQQEQYTGWLKLNPANPNDEALECAKTMIMYCGFETDTAKVLREREEFDRVWRAAVLGTHTDTGGDVEAFQKVMTARDRLKKLKGW